jgi:transposase-like protein
MERYINLGVLTVEEVRKSLFDNSDSRIMLNQQSFNAMTKEKEENKKIMQQLPNENEEKVINKDAKLRFIPEGEVLPASFYEELSIAELMDIPED